MSSGRRVLCAVAAGFLTVLASFYAAQNALAHDKLLRAAPLDGSTVRTSPRLVTLYFEEPPGTGFSSLTVRSPSGSDVATGPAVISGSQMSVPVHELTTVGVYAIHFAIVSDDGHPVSGVLHFTYQPVAIAHSPAAERGGGAPTSGAGSASGLGWVAFAATTIAVLTIGYAVRRRPARQGPIDAAA